MAMRPQETRTDVFEIAQDIRDERLRRAKALKAPGFGVGGMEKEADAVVLDLDMPADRQGRQAPAADRPQAEESENQPIPILPLARLVARHRQGESRVHQFDGEVERLAGRRQPFKAVAWPRAGDQPRLDREQPSPVALAGDQPGGVAKALNGQRHGGRTHFRAEQGEIVAHALERNAIGRRRQKVVGVRGVQKPQPAAIAHADASSAALRQMRPGPARFIEHVAGQEGRVEGLTIRSRPLRFGKMLHEAHDSPRR